MTPADHGTTLLANYIICTTDGIRTTLDGAISLGRMPSPKIWSSSPGPTLTTCQWTRLVPGQCLRLLGTFYWDFESNHCQT